jgi:hypothetical protein
VLKTTLSEIERVFVTEGEEARTPSLSGRSWLFIYACLLSTKGAYYVVNK